MTNMTNRRSAMPARVMSEVGHHKYEVGQLVDFTPAASPREKSVGRYEIVRQLPPDGADNQYRVKSVQNSQERVVRESQLG